MEFKILHDLSLYNVLFITLDACRYDTTQLASIPYLESLGGFRKSHTHGDYTYPAHMSFFMGYIPSIVEPPFQDFYCSEVKQLWRLNMSRPRNPNECGLMLDGLNILDGYRRRGYSVIGSGGVRWFRHSYLTSLFDEFYYYGESDYESVFKLRKENEFPLNHIDELIKYKSDSKQFLFLNCPETHVPYDVGNGYLVEGSGKIIDKFKPIWGFKTLKEKTLNLDSSLLATLHKSQIVALETIDSKIKNFVERMPKPLLLVITGDHGECFGEDGHWGHGFPHEKVLEVPILITTIE